MNYGTVMNSKYVFDYEDLLPSDDCDVVSGIL